MSKPEEITKAIFNQIGGRTLMLMLGITVANCMQIDNKVQGNGLMIGKIKSAKVNTIDIILNGKDLYDVTFYMKKITKGYDVKITKRIEFKDIYCDGLMDLIGAQTGLYLTLNARG